MLCCAGGWGSVCVCVLCASHHIALSVAAEGTTAHAAQHYMRRASHNNMEHPLRYTAESGPCFAAHPASPRAQAFISTHIARSVTDGQSMAKWLRPLRCLGRAGRVSRCVALLPVAPPLLLVGHPLARCEVHITPGVLLASPDKLS